MERFQLVGVHALQPIPEPRAPYTTQPLVQLLALLAEAHQHAAAVGRVLSSLGESALDEAVDQLAGGRLTDLQDFGDLCDGGGSVVGQRTQTLHL